MAVPLLDLQRAFLLAADNFTPLLRTPWAGHGLADLYKADILKPGAERRIGESWEFSCDSSYPSYLADQKTLLTEFINNNPVAVLSHTHSQVGCNILVKLISAAQPLSLQLHPTDGHPTLKVGECGKPESWLILHREPGSGIYLGFKRALSLGEMQDLLSSSDSSMEKLLHFIPVEQGDYFEIEPGMPHGIGAGITLLEPQRVHSGMTGVTYRMWDWNRKYLPNGELDLEKGSPRTLHIDACLHIIDPRITGPDLQARSQKIGAKQSIGPGTDVTVFPANTYCQVQRLHMRPGASASAEVRDGYGIVTVLRGEVRLVSKHTPGITVKLQRGRTALLPSVGFPFVFHASVNTDATLIAPNNAATIWS